MTEVRDVTENLERKTETIRWKNLIYENKYLQEERNKEKEQKRKLQFRMEKLYEEYREIKCDRDNLLDETNDLKNENKKLIDDKYILKYESNRKINKIVEHYKIIERYYKDTSCSICLEVTGDKIVTECGHTFHKECFSKIINKKCPMCRTIVSYNLFGFESTPITFKYYLNYI